MSIRRRHPELGHGFRLNVPIITGFPSGSRRCRATATGENLPRYQGPLEDGEETVEQSSPSVTGKETVLVIDDEPSIRMLAVDVLEERGYKTLEAGDGPSGLKVLEQYPEVELLVTDVGLPNGMNGRQVADAARAVKPSLKVLFITGYAETSVWKEGNSEKGMQVLTKPFTVDSLAKKVAELLE